MFEAIEFGEVRFPNKKLNHFEVSRQAKDLIRKLLNKDKNLRIGAQGGITEVLCHPFFINIDKVKLLRKKLDPPYKP